jgi:hypothetical protein
MQEHISRQERTHTSQTNVWLASNGINADTLGDVHIKLLQAQKQAHLLLTHHMNLLDDQQKKTLEHFKFIMANKWARQKLKPAAAFPILNISCKINRQLFRLHKQI